MELIEIADKKVAGEAELRAEFEQLIFLEARLMDDSRYEEWLELWDTGECLYWVPLNDFEGDPETRVALIYDNRERIEDRVTRLTSKAVPSQIPRSRLMRSLSNIIILSATDEEISGTSQFILGEVRNDHQTIIFGRNEHVLVHTPAGLKIKSKKVFLLGSDMTVGNMTYLL